MKFFFSRKTKDKKLCIIQANCIAHQLRHFLMLSQNFSAAYEVKIYTNFTRDPIPETELRACGLFIHQYLDAKWDDLASEVLTRKAGPHCRCVTIPSFFWRFLWPYWTADDERMKPSPESPFGLHPYGDSFILKHMEEGMAKAEIIRTYLELDVNSLVDLDALFEEDFARERDRERNLDVRIVDYVVGRFRHERLMTSVNHPTNIIILKIANDILRALNCDPIPPAILDHAVEFGDYHVPIHPSVIRHFGLTFVDDGSRYLMSGKMRTFSEYLEDYIDNA